jgi:hypothetical protein
MTNIFYIGNNFFDAKRVFFFPEMPSVDNGYTMAVTADFNRFLFGNDDLIIVWTAFYDESIMLFEKLHNELGINAIIVLRKRNLAYQFWAIFSLRHPSVFYSKSLSTLFERFNRIEYVFCGETTFYFFMNSIRGFFEREVRFHNVWMKIFMRQRIYSFKVADIVMSANLFYFDNLEKKIFKAPVDKILINQSDLNFYKVMTGDTKGRVWSVIDDLRRNEFISDKLIFNIDGSLQIIWFGSVSGHMKGGLYWFIKNVYKPLIDEGFFMRFDLFGEGSLSFSSERYRIKGHGRFIGLGLPLDGLGLFINPDLLGGGIKMKIKYFLENNLKFLSTPFGVEGYEKIEMDNYALIEHPNHWPSSLRTLLTGSK